MQEERLSRDQPGREEIGARAVVDEDVQSQETGFCFHFLYELKTW